MSYTLVIVANRYIAVSKHSHLDGAIDARSALRTVHPSVIRDGHDSHRMTGTEIEDYCRTVGDGLAKAGAT